MTVGFHYVSNVFFLYFPTLVKYNAQGLRNKKRGDHNLLSLSVIFVPFSWSQFKWKV